jgi:hypothetical protein
MEITKVNTNTIEDSIPIENSRLVLSHFMDLQKKSFDNNKVIITESLTDELTSLFGECNKKMKLDYMTQVWVLKYKNFQFNIFSANERGTDIEICGLSFIELNTREMDKEIIKFLDIFYDMINSTKNEK